MFSIFDFFNICYNQFFYLKLFIDTKLIKNNILGFGGYGGYGGYPGWQPDFHPVNIFLHYILYTLFISCIKNFLFILFIIWKTLSWVEFFVHLLIALSSWLCQCLTHIKLIGGQAWFIIHILVSRCIQTFYLNIILKFIMVTMLLSPGFSVWLYA